MNAFIHPSFSLLSCLYVPEFDYEQKIKIDEKVLRIFYKNETYLSFNELLKKNKSLEIYKERNDERYERT